MRKIIENCDKTWNSLAYKITKYNVRKPSNIYIITCALNTISDVKDLQFYFFDSGVNTDNSRDKYVGVSIVNRLDQIIKQTSRNLLNKYSTGFQNVFYGLFQNVTITTIFIKGTDPLFNIQQENRK